MVLLCVWGDCMIGLRWVVLMVFSVSRVYFIVD